MPVIQFRDVTKVYPLPAAYSQRIIRLGDGRLA